MASNLSFKNNQVTTISKDIIIDWNSVISKLYNLHVTKIVSIKGTIAEKYRGDMYGLFKYLDIQEEFIYPHIRVNGYNSSRDYGGSTSDIKIIDSSILNVYYEMFTK